MKPAPLVADAHRPRVELGERQVVEVAVGILIQSNDDFLLTSRPAGKVYSGYWEFPGGKLEAGDRSVLCHSSCRLPRHSI